VGSGYTKSAETNKKEQYRGCGHWTGLVVQWKGFYMRNTSQIILRGPLMKKINKDIIRLIVIALIVISALIGLFIYLGSQEEVVVITKETSTPSADNGLEEDTNKLPSYSAYLQDIYASEGEKVTLLGRLRRSIDDSGIHVFSLVDDDKNQIKLEGIYNKLKSYLPEVGETKEVYSIKGTFGRDYKQLFLDVSSVNLYEPPKKEIEEKINEVTEPETIEILVPTHPLISFLLNKITGKENICTDGTKYGSCSIEKPMYCSFNGLTENSGQCGCPEGQKIYLSKCIAKNSCSDGTLESDCSPTLKKQCIAGKFVFNSGLCGCPNKYIPNGKDCVKACDES